MSQRDDLNVDIVKEVRAGYARGWSYTPLRGGDGKRPILDKWNVQPRPSLQQCLDWATRGNVGVRTGQASGVVVVDVDPVPDGAAHPIDFPLTVTAVTPRGGRHFYYQLPKRITLKNWVKQLGESVDVRSDGGQVVSVGGVNPQTGAMYTWEHSPDDVEVAACPEDLLQALYDRHQAKKRASDEAKAPAAPAAQVRVDRSRANASRVNAYAAEALKRELSAVAAAKEGNRNHTLNVAAYNLGQLVGGGQIDETEVIASLAQAVALAGWDYDERGRRQTEATIRSGLDKGKRSPRYPRPPQTQPQAGRQPATVAAPDRLTTTAEHVEHDDPNGRTLDAPNEPPPSTAAGSPDGSQPSNGNGKNGHAHDHAKQQPPIAPILIQLSTVQPVPVTWLWHNRIAIGKLTLISGDPGLGKSFLTLDIASRVSTGSGWPDRAGETFEPADTVLLSAEDDMADTVRPRVDAAVGDPSRVYVLQGIKKLVRQENGSRKAVVSSFSLETDVPRLEQALDLLENPKLVVIDPISAYLGSKDSHNNAEVRGLLAPLAELAQRRHIAVVCVNHLNKGGSNSRAIYRAMGSLAFAAAARTAWLITQEKENPRRRLMLPMKNNLAPDTSGLAYSIEGEALNACLAWESAPVTNVSADEALAAMAEAADGDKIDDVIAWLLAFLGDASPGAGKPAKAVIREAKALGFSEKTLRRAKQSLNIKSESKGFSRDREWTWILPETKAPIVKQNEPGVPIGF